MKPLSPRASALLAELHRPDRWPERVLGRAEHDARVLGELAEHAELALVPRVAPLVLDPTRAVRHAAAMVLDHALAAATSTDLLHLDVMCRGYGWGSATSEQDAWRTLSPVRLSAFDDLGAAALAPLGVASFHANGYVRETAVAWLDGWADGRELPFLLIRLNDWVPAVAQRALDALSRRVVPAYAAAWLVQLPLLRRLGTHTRRDAGELTERVVELLRAPEQRAVLRTGLATGDRVTRRAAFRLLADAESESAARVDLVATALRDADPVLRVEAVAYAHAQLPEDELEHVIPVCVADRYPRVRREGLAAAAERLGGRADPWLVACLLDSAATVRELARYYLRRRGTLTTFAAHYRDHLAGDVDGALLAATLTGAIAGLGETGTADDVALLLPFLRDGRVRVRRATVRAIGHLDADGQRTVLLGMLGDPSPGVTHAARDVLRARAGTLDAATIGQVLRSAVHAHGQRDALVLAGALTKWESLLVLVGARGMADAAVRADAGRRIATWLARENQSFVQPSPVQLAALRTALDTHGRWLPQPTRVTLHAVLDYWSRQ